MRFNSKWLRATLFFGVLSLIAAQVEPLAFGQKTDDSVNEDRSPQSVSPGRASEAPADARQSVTQVATQGRPEDVAVQPNRLPAAPAKAPSKRKVGKWLAIIGVGVAAVAVAILARGSQPDIAAESPAIVVGPPTVGQPQ